MQLQAEIVVGWHRSLRLCIQHAGAVFMPYFDFATNIGRVHNKPFTMYIEVDVHVCNENAGVQSRIVYRCFFNGRGSIGITNSTARAASTPRQRRGMIPPCRCNTGSARSMMRPAFDRKIKVLT